ncbi:MAG: 50S ribosomal protein L25 [Calditrichota bacterium]
MAELKLKAQKRDMIGRGAAKKYRQDGWIPAEYYSSQKDNIHLIFNQKEFESKLLHAHGLLELEVEGEKEKVQCVLKDLQIDPVKETLVHADFQGVKLGEKLTLDIPIVLKGTAAGVKAGGILEFITREVEIECFPNDIPDNLEIDVTGLEIGDSVRIKDLKFDKIRILDDEDDTILIVEHAKVVQELEEAEVEEGEEEVQEPEVITARREEEEGKEEKE